MIDALTQYVKKRTNPEFLLLVFLATLCSYFSIGFLHPDEQYYTLDFSFFKLGLLNSLETWEYNSLIRPWSLSYIFYCIMLPFNYLGINDPFLLATICRFASSILGVFTLITFTQSLKDLFSKTQFKYFNLYTLFFWPLIFMNSRTSTDHWSTSFFILGLSLVLKYKVITRRTLLASGLLFGLAFSIRHQTGLLSLSFGLWLLIFKKVRVKDWFCYFVFTIIIGVLIGLYLDILGYDQITFTPYNYLKVNILDDKISGFGLMPWWGYFKLIIKTLHIWGVILLGSSLLYIYKKPKSWASIIWISYFLFHSMIGHKELRFIYPLIYISIYMCFKIIPIEKFKKTYLILFILNMVFTLFIIIKPAYTPLTFYKFLYHFKKSENISLYVFKDRKKQYPKLEMKVYKREGLKLIRFENKKDSVQSFYAFTTKYYDFYKIYQEYNCTTNFISYPKWILKFNIFKWRNRSNIWALSTCKPITQ